MKFSRNVAYATICAIVCAGQLLAQSYFFPLSELLTEKPLIYTDSPFHLYKIASGATLCRDGNFIGYDPFFHGGYISGTTYTSSSKLQTALACLTTASPVVIYKVVSFAFGAIAPLLVLFTCFRLRVSPIASVFATLAATSLWWASPMRWYHINGMVSYVFVCFFSLAYATELAVRSLRKPAPRVPAIAVLAILGALGGVIHPHFALIMPPLVIVVICSLETSNRRRIRGMGWVLGVGALVVCLSLLWIWPSLQLPRAISLDHQYQRIVDWTIPFKEMLEISPTAKGGSRFFAVLLIATVAAIPIVHGTDRRLTLAFLLSGVAFLTVASIGAANSVLAYSQPNRLSPMGWLLLCIPFGICAATVVNRLKPTAPALNAIFRIGYAAVGVVLAIGLGYQGYNVARELSEGSHSRFGVAVQEVKGVGHLTAQLLKHYSDQPMREGRILFETSAGRIHDNAHIAGLVAIETGRELIGGPYSGAGSTSIGDGRAFGLPLTEIAPNQLRKLLSLYDVTSAVCHTQACTLAFQGLFSANEKSISNDKTTLTIFELHRLPNRFLVGEGQIGKSTWNRLEVSAVRPDASEGVVLKYHWAPGLQVTPDAEIRPYSVDGTSGPFVHLPHPPTQFTLHY